MAIRRSPAEYYLKYLVVHPDDYANEQIRNLLQMQQLDFIGMPYLDRLRMSLATPAPFYPEDRNHKRSQTFLFKERIWGLFHPDEDVLGAQAVLDKPRVKETLEALLVSLATPEYTAAVLRSRAGIDMTSRSVQLYKHFFFNTDLVDSIELQALLETRVGITDLSDPDVNRQQTALLAASARDPRRLAARVSVSPLAGLMNSMRMGYLPTNLNISKLAAATRAAALVQTHHAAMTGSSERTRDFALATKMMSEILENVGDASQDLQGDLAQMLLATEHTEVPHIDDLREPKELPALIVEAKGESIEPR
jgi:hypothetical protein